MVETPRQGLRSVTPLLHYEAQSWEPDAGLPPERRIEFHIGIYLGDVVGESGGDYMGDGVNTAARLRGSASPAIRLSEDVHR
jgi:adenylate cyclase